MLVREHVQVHSLTRQFKQQRSIYPGPPQTRLQCQDNVLIRLGGRHGSRRDAGSQGVRKIVLQHSLEWPRQLACIASLRLQSPRISAHCMCVGAIAPWPSPTIMIMRLQSTAKPRQGWSIWLPDSRQCMRGSGGKKKQARLTHRAQGRRWPLIPVLKSRMFFKTLYGAHMLATRLPGVWTCCAACNLSDAHAQLSASMPMKSQEPWIQAGMHA